jgi:hypothetical protein
MKSFKLLFAVTGLSMMSIITYAAQETKKPAYKPKEASQATENNPVLIFKVTKPETAEPVKKAGRAERTSAIPNINRLKAENTRKTVVLGMV